MDKNLPIDNAFGNYLLNGISEIRRPEPVSWAPKAPGFYIVGVILAIVLFRAGFRLFNAWRKNAYRRRALAKLDRLEKNKGKNSTVFLLALPGILRETALCAYPGDQAGSLTGKTWLEFLESRHPGSEFTQDIGRQLFVIAYQDPQNWRISSREAEKLTCMVKNWIRQHRSGDTHA